MLGRSEALVADARRQAGGTWQPWSLQRKCANRKLAPQKVTIAKSGRTRFEPIGPFVASTYVSIRATCPSGCPFKDAGCYAQAGATHLTMGRLDRAARGLDPLEVTRAEARGLASAWVRGVPADGARGGRDLRLHVGGETSCTTGARELGEAVGVLKGRGLGAAWTFTHRWRTIPRAAFGPINVLASVESHAEIGAAAARGYAAALTVPAFPGDPSAPAPWRARGFKVVPCPFETGAPVTCSSCRLCLDHDLLGTGRAIAFAVHGEGSDRARQQLVQIGRGGSVPSAP